MCAFIKSLFCYSSWWQIGLLFVLSIVWSPKSSAQINVFTADTMNQLNRKAGFYNKARLDFTHHSGNTTMQFFKLRYRSDYVSTIYHLFAVGDFQIRSKDFKAFVNRGMIHGRAIRLIKPKQMLESFIQKQFSQSIFLRDRNLVGGGVRIQIFGKSDEHDNSDLNLYLGIGAMWEYELIENTELANIATNLLRSTNYISLNYPILSQVSVSLTSYYQVDLGKISDFRLLTELNITYQLTKQIQSFTSVNSRYDNDPPNNLSLQDLQINNGIIISF